jgi:hypothetical protein
MKPSGTTAELHSRINWGSLADLRRIERLAARCAEVLKGVRALGVDSYISAREIHEIIYVQAGKKFASNPSNISTALQSFDGRLEKKHVDGSMKFRFPSDASSGQASSGNISVDSLLLGICERFHRAVSHLAHRRKGKHNIDFSDEYDVQDVFGTILKSVYDDVRDEEWTPSYAGASARIDFVVADIHTAAELKRARPRQAIEDELILDIARYGKHPNVQRLVCFVYDPDGLLRRDAGQIETDLSGRRTHNGHELDVVVLIRPH